MDLSFGYSPWLLVASLIIAGGLSYWTYRRTVPALGGGWRGLLGGLRFLALALILFLLLEPVVRHLNETTQPPLLAVLVDDSESMRLVTGDGDSTSAETTRSALRPALAPFADDFEVGSARFFAFDDEVRALSASPVDSLSFGGSRTDIGSALERLPDEVQGANLQGVVLVSDGQYNAGQTPVRVADRYPVPIHTVTVGDTTQRRDLQVSRVTTNDVAYTDSEVPVRATLQGERLDATTVSVTLHAGDSLVAETDVRLPGGTAELPVDLSFQPQRPGLKQLTVRASPVPNEATTRNNTRSTTLRVLDRKRQVLLLGGAPSPSFTAVRRVLERDADTRVTARVSRQDGSFYGGSLPDTLSRYDVIFSVGFPSEAVPSSTIQRIAEPLEAGTPAIFFLDRQTDVTAWSDHFGTALPATPASSSLRLRSAVPSVEESARTHPIFQIEGASLDLLGQLPPLQVPTSAWQATPDADVLATAASSSGGEGAPLLVVRERAGRRSALFLGTGTWRWATLPSSLREADPLWPGLVSNVLRWTTTQDADQQVRVRPVASQFEGDERIGLTGQVYDESMSPVASASVDVTILDSTGTEYSYTMDPMGNGRYELDVGSLPEGTYQYEATAQQSGTPLGRDQGQFSVGALAVEYQTPRADPVLMQQIAERSGGQAYRPSSLSSLPNDLADSPSFSADVVTNPTEDELWRRWVFLAAILLLLTAEWGLRKRLGLS